MDVVQVVNRLDSYYKLSNVEPTLFLAQDVFSHQKSHQVTSRKKLHYEVQVFLILE